MSIQKMYVETPSRTVAVFIRFVPVQEVWEGVRGPDEVGIKRFPRILRERNQAFLRSMKA